MGTTIQLSPWVSRTVSHISFSFLLVLHASSRLATFCILHHLILSPAPLIPCLQGPAKQRCSLFMLAWSLELPLYLSYAQTTLPAWSLSPLSGFLAGSSSALLISMTTVTGQIWDETKRLTTQNWWPQYRPARCKKLMYARGGITDRGREGLPINGIGTIDELLGKKSI